MPNTLLNAAASTANPTRLILSQKDAARPIHVRFRHPGVAEYVQASGWGNAATGDQGYYLNGKTGREAIYVEFYGDARYEIQFREAGVKHAPWQTLDGWQALVGATALTGNPTYPRIF